MKNLIFSMSHLRRKFFPRKSESNIPTNQLPLIEKPHAINNGVVKAASRQQNRLFARNFPQKPCLAQ
jgi:hypothetical protein